MKNVIHNLKAIEERISDTLTEIKVLKMLPFIKIFSRSETKEVEINMLRLSLRDYYGAKLSILENMEIEIRKEKMRLSQLMRDNSLKKTG